MRRHKQNLIYSMPPTIENEEFITFEGTLKTISNILILLKVRLAILQIPSPFPKAVPFFTFHYVTLRQLFHLLNVFSNLILVPSRHSQNLEK
jgi:hypothetical protein